MIKKNPTSIIKRLVANSSTPSWVAIVNWHLMPAQGRRRPQRIAAARVAYSRATQVPGTPPKSLGARSRAFVGRFLGTLLYLAVIIVPALAVISCAAILGAGT